MFDISKCWKSGMTGMGGNYRVASELLLRDLNVSFPAVDTGVDLEVEGIVRVQVKSAHAMKRPADYKSGMGYNFSLMRGPRALGGGQSIRSEKRVFSKTCDFVVLFGIEQGRFWIVPAMMLDGRASIYLGTDSRWIATDEARIQAMLESGMTQRDIANELGVSEMTLSRRARGIMSQPGEVVAELNRIRDCEGRWDLIQSCINTMREVYRVTCDKERLTHVTS